MSKSIIRFMRLFFAIILLALSLFIAYHYWFVLSVSQLRDIPTLVMSSLILYIVLQLIKRMLVKKMEWYEYSYYLGLIGVLLPFIVPGNSDWMLSLSRYGVLFLFVPPIGELILFSRKKV
jgi:hypothetical protein